MATEEDLVHGWVSTHCGRGTSDILWSCLATIVLCVWTVIHLPVPCCSRFESGRLVPGTPERSRRRWVITSGFVSAVIGVTAPEFLAIIALSEFSAAWKSKRKYMARMHWSLTHAFFFDAGGFCLEAPSGLRRQIDDGDLTKAFSASSAPDWLFKLTAVEDTNINDHAKSSSLTKFIACGQAIWLVTQVLTRLHQHQAITLLEVSTTAYAACALTAYVAWWEKPQNAIVPITIPCTDEEFPDANTEDSKYYSEKHYGEYVWAGRAWHEEVDDERIAYLFILCSAIFGVIHLASWNISLLSNTE